MYCNSEKTFFANVHFFRLILQFCQTHIMLRTTWNKPWNETIWNKKIK